MAPAAVVIPFPAAAGNITEEPIGEPFSKMGECSAARDEPLWLDAVAILSSAAVGKVGSPTEVVWLAINEEFWEFPSSSVAATKL